MAFGSHSGDSIVVHLEEILSYIGVIKMMPSNIIFFPFFSFSHFLDCLHKKCKYPCKTGPCHAFHKMYYYNVHTRHCQKFIYGGCGGNPNRFKRLNDCIRKCSQCEFQIMKRQCTFCQYNACSCGLSVPAGSPPQTSQNLTPFTKLHPHYQAHAFTISMIRERKRGKL